ncbi:MAG: SPOR domain-containing protein [Saprospiraceae bacterium]
MLRITQTILYLVLLLVSLDLTAQKLLRKAEIQAENGEYSKACTNYKAYLKDHPTDYATMAQLAKTLVNEGQLSQADEWYQLIPVSTSVDPVAYRDHGHLLKSLMRYDDAITKYKAYGLYNPAMAEYFVNGCHYAKKAMAEKPIYEAIVMPSNSAASDFGLTFYKDMPVFSSFRTDILMTASEKELNQAESAHKSFLYQAEKNRLVFIKGMNGNLQNIGPLSFTKDGQKCAIIESKMQDKYQFIQHMRNASLHIAQVNENGEITSSKPFPFNEVGSSINAAHLAFDGSALYFSSDRKGGFGGFDIYVCYWNDDRWSIPQNLGNTINTEGNEITPYLKSNSLYFASDYHSGLGGYDIVVSEVVDAKWSAPVNLGNGVNSPADDYFPAINAMEELYVTSNRLGGRGNNDIYKTYKLKTVPAVTKPDILAAMTPPPAVSLDELAAQTTKHTVDPESASKVSAKEESPMATAFKLPSFDATKVGTNALEDLEVEGAHRVSVQDLVPNTEVFFIQLASISSSKPNFSIFTPLLKYGNIYKMFNDRSIKVRLGYFTDRKEAEEILAKVKASGYKDAFLAFEFLNSAKMELVLSGSDESSFTDKGNFNTRNPEVAKTYKSSNKYKVRLASYEDPIWFDINKVKDLGRIEQWTKGGWTIFILAGFDNLDEAKNAQIQALNRGFKTSEVVIDNGGILERLTQN